MTDTERAETLFKEGYNCTQAVLGAFSDKLGITTEQAFAIAAPFGGGMGGTHGVCGALSGLLMVYGLVSGGEDKQKKPEVRAKTRELMDAFSAKTGFILCRDLLGIKEGAPAPLKNRPCPEIVRTAAEIAEQLFKEN